MTIPLLLCLLCAPPADVRCEWRPDGGVTSDPCPEFSWLSAEQAAWRIVVGTSAAQLDQPDLWDSGRVESDLLVAEYAGRPLPVGQPVAYRLTVRDQAGREATVGPFTVTYQPVELPRLYPTARAFLNFSAPLEFMAQHYDVTFRPEAKELRPGLQAFRYSLMATMVVPSEKCDQLSEYCVQAGLTKAGPDESMFLHYGEDTKVKLHVGKEAADHPIEERAIPGWDPANDRNGDGTVSDAEARHPANPRATARTPKQARVPIYYWGPPRDDYVLYPGSANYQRYLAEVYVPFMAQGCDGLYIDTMPTTPPGPAAGRVLAEYRETGAAGWRRDILAMIAFIKRAHPDLPLVGNGWRSTPFVMDGMQDENWLDLRANATKITAEVQVVRELDRRGKWQWIQYNNIVLDDQPSFAPKLPVEPDRDRLFGAAVYFLAHGDDTCYGYGRHPYGRLWKYWPSCIGVDLGRPVGEPESTELSSPEAAIDRPNLLPNGGFEHLPVPDRPLPGWEPLPPFDVTDDHPKLGQHCLHMASTDPGVNNITRCVLTLKPHTDYTLSGWMRTDRVDGSGAQIYIYDFEGVSQAPMLTARGTTPWTRYELAFRTADDATGRVNIRLFRSTGQVWFDDLRLVEGRFVTESLLSRRYRKGLVLVRPNAGGGYGDDTQRVIKLDQPYRPVDVDGKPGPATSTITLREAEAAILLR